MKVKTIKYILPVAASLAAMMISCTKEDIKTRYSRQEENIESFVNSTLSSVDTGYVVRNKGVDRVVIVPGEGDSLSTSGTVSFYYAGYVLTGSSISSSSLFATNNKEIASGLNWNLSDSTVFAVKTLKLDSSGLVDGLRYGLEGVKSGQECYVLFSGKYGFGKRPLGTIPANSALVYHIWVESISNN